MAPSDLDDLDDILSKFPLVIPRGPIDVTNEQHRYRTEEDEYFIRKAPVLDINGVSGTVNNQPNVLFVEGSDFQIIDADGDGELDTIDWSIGGDTPDDGSDFYIDYRADSVIKRYIAAHDSDVDDIETDIDNVIEASQVDRADQDDLDRVGAIFGELGRRRNRADSDYRRLLKSIVQSFTGRGTVPGIKFAISAGSGIDEQNITINEDFSQVGYSIEIDSSVDSGAITPVISDMAELADPSGVELLEDPVFLLDGDTIPVEKTETSVVSTESGLGSGTLDLDGTKQLT